MTWLEMLFVGGTTFVILGLLLVAALLYQRALGIVPGGAVSAVSRAVPASIPPATESTTPVTLRHTAIRQAEHRYRMECIAAKRRRDTRPDGRTAPGRTVDGLDVTQIRAQIEGDVWQQVRATLKDRQRKSLDTYLVEKWQRIDDKGKLRPVRREDIYGLLGQRDEDVRTLIDELEDIRRLQSLPPLPPELAQMEPLPT